MIIPPGYASCLLPVKHSGLSRSAAVTWGVDMNGQGGSVGLANKIQGDFTGEFANRFTTEITLGPLRLSVGQDGGEPLTYIAGGTTAGSASNQTLPPNCSLILNKGTNRGGRRGRGRMFIPWVLDETSVDEAGIINPTMMGIFATAATDFLNQLSSDLGPTLATPMVVLHSEGSSAPGSPSLVVSLTPSNLIGSQRRRLGRS